MDKIVLATGGFDPIHSGHIQYLQAALQLGNRLVVGLNSDAWLQRKKGRSFMPFAERKAIVENLKGITMCLGFDDKDNSAKDAIYQVSLRLYSSVKGLKLTETSSRWALWLRKVIDCIAVS